MSTVNVFRFWPDDFRAHCTCGWQGNAHIFGWLAKLDAKQHARDMKHELGAPLVLMGRP